MNTHGMNLPRGEKESDMKYPLRHQPENIDIIARSETSRSMTTLPTFSGFFARLSKYSGLSFQRPEPSNVPWMTGGNQKWRDFVPDEARCHLFAPNTSGESTSRKAGEAIFPCLYEIVDKTAFALRTIREGKARRWHREFGKFSRKTRNVQG
jgi:hypothetical protein